MTPQQNPPVPGGYRSLAQVAVTPAMTAWAVRILHDAASYPMFATATASFGSLSLLARVEWHAADFQNHAVHRGVTLYQRLASEAATHVDPLFATHWAQAKQAGMLRGAYHFFRPQVDAAAQARLFLAQLNDRGELPPVLDVEAWFLALESATGPLSTSSKITSYFRGERLMWSKTSPTTTSRRGSSSE